jgi:adenylate kinase family enzyme
VPARDVTPIRRPTRIVVNGPSGSGKTTLAKSIAAMNDWPYLELDNVFHLSGWTEIEPEAFRNIVATFAEQPSWVSDGNYRVVRDLLWGRAEMIVIIDLPKSLVIRRVLGRTIRRGFFREPLWNGNRESLTNLFSRDPDRNIVLWSWNTHHLYHDLLAEQARSDAPHVQVVVLRSVEEVANFVEQFRPHP